MFHAVVEISWEPVIQFIVCLRCFQKQRVCRGCGFAHKCFHLKSVGDKIQRNIRVTFVTLQWRYLHCCSSIVSHV